MNYNKKIYSKGSSKSVRAYNIRKKKILFYNEEIRDKYNILPLLEIPDESIFKNNFLIGKYKIFFDNTWKLRWFPSKGYTIDDQYESYVEDISSFVSWLLDYRIPDGTHGIHRYMLDTSAHASFLINSSKNLFAYDEDENIDKLNPPTTCNSTYIDFDADDGKYGCYVDSGKQLYFSMYFEPSKSNTLIICAYRKSTPAYMSLDDNISSTYQIFYNHINKEYPNEDKMESYYVKGTLFDAKLNHCFSYCMDYICDIREAETSNIENPSIYEIYPHYSSNDSYRIITYKEYSRSNISAERITATLYSMNMDNWIFSLKLFNPSFKSINIINECKSFVSWVLKEMNKSILENSDNLFYDENDLPEYHFYSQLKYGTVEVIYRKSGLWKFNFFM